MTNIKKKAQVKGSIASMFISGGNKNRKVEDIKEKEKPTQNKTPVYIL